MLNFKFCLILFKVRVLYCITRTDAHKRLERYNTDPEKGGIKHYHCPGSVANHERDHLNLRFTVKT